MSRLVVDNQVIEIEDGCIIYCSPPEGMDNGGQAVYWSWSQASPELKQAFLKLRRQWSEMMTKFMQDNREALDALRSVDNEDAGWEDECPVNPELHRDEDEFNPGEVKDTRLVLTPGDVKNVETETQSIQQGPILVFTDGACSPNPGRGGWGVVINSGEVTELSGSHPDSTNNRMEMTAAIQALKSLPPGCTIVLTTDSMYVRDGLTQWLPKWKRNGWKTASKTRVKNEDLWRELDAVCCQHTVKWEWIKGHSGHPENERCDQLAHEAIEGLAR